MTVLRSWAAGAAALIVTSGAVLAQDAPRVGQGGADTARFAAIAARIRMPPGFRISLFAIVPDARAMAVGPGGVVFVGTRRTKIYAVADRNGDRVADEVVEFAPSIAKRVPNGVCVSPDGTLYSAESRRIMAYPSAESAYGRRDVAAGIVTDTLVPADETSSNHGARVCAVGPDGRVYVAIGQPFNVPPPEKAATYDAWGMGGIVRMDRDGRNREVFARGIRNSVGLAFNPASGELWFTDNQVDGMGDDVPPGEIDRATAPGQHFGFPWYGGGHVRTIEYGDSAPPADARFPEVETVAHAADLGLSFYTGGMFPPGYRGGIFSAQHGSWNRTRPVGARVLFTQVNPDGTAGGSRPFAEGWLDEGTGQYLGRPVDAVPYVDGSLLVSDDLAGAIWRIAYTGG